MFELVSYQNVSIKISRKLLLDIMAVIINVVFKKASPLTDTHNVFLNDDAAYLLAVIELSLLLQKPFLETN